MSNAIEIQKISLERKKEKLRVQERLLKEKEKQKSAQRARRLADLITEFDLQDLDREVLIGAFSFLKERLSDPAFLRECQERSEKHLSQKEAGAGTPLAIRFAEPPGQDLKARLKALGFRWNAFRGEFYGFGSKGELSDQFQEFDHTIEVL